jgi:hypothetical protein
MFPNNAMGFIVPLHPVQAQTVMTLVHTHILSCSTLLALCVYYDTPSQLMNKMIVNLIRDDS